MRHTIRPAGGWSVVLNPRHGSFTTSAGADGREWKLVYVAGRGWKRRDAGRFRIEVGHGGQLKPAVWLLAVASFGRGTALAQDLVAALEQARGKALVDLSNRSKYVCIETIERDYYSRAVDPESPPSCERIAIDKKEGQGYPEAR